MWKEVLKGIILDVKLDVFTKAPEYKEQWCNMLIKLTGIQAKVKCPFLSLQMFVCILCCMCLETTIFMHKNSCTYFLKKIP